MKDGGLAKMKKLILFSHHYVDDVVVKRFENLQQLNPSWDIISIGFEGYELIENSVKINRNKYPTNNDIHYYVPNNNIDWFNGDFCLYESYLKFPDYDEYFLYEYDTICNVSIENFFNTTVDFFGSTICNPASEDWEWVKLYRKHNINNIHFKTLYSCGQTTCLYFKNEILKKCVNELFNNIHLYNNMFSEVRCGTIVNQFAKLNIGRNYINNFISWTSKDININLNQSYFYHPVK